MTGLKEDIAESRSQESNERTNRSMVLTATFAIEPIEHALRFWAETLAVPLDIVLSPYGQVMQQLLDPLSDCSRNSGGFNVLLVRLEDSVRDLPRTQDLRVYAKHLDRTVSEWADGIKALSVRSAASTFILLCPPSNGLSRADTQYLDTLGENLMRQVNEVPGVFCLRHSDVMALYPVVAVDDPHADRIAHIPYSLEYYTAVATTIVRRVVRLLSPPYKVIVVDCDNTLWGGLCGERDSADLELTDHYLRLQRMLVGLQEAGVLLCLCSKNTSSDVENVFHSRTDMPLQAGHIVSRRINWDAKSNNIRSLASELNLGLDSFIFIDDSLAECAEVRAACPEVLTLQLPLQPQGLNNFLEHTWVLDPPVATADARKRNARYRDSRQREAAMAAATDLTAFLAGIKLNVRVTTPEVAHMERVAELIVRTNQFNLTTVRRSPAELDALVRQPDVHLKVVHVSDRFGDYGLTGVLILRGSGGVALVDTFLLSCRVLGRGVESSVVNQLGAWASELSFGHLQFEYRRTARNTPARLFLKRAFGVFEEASAEGGTYKVSVSYAMALTAVQCASDESRQTVADETTDRREVVAPPQWYRAGLTGSLCHVADIVEAIERHRSTLDKRAHAQNPSNARGVSSASGHPPKGVVEESLAQIWRETLSLPFISREAGFVESGGDSVRVVRLLSKIAQRFTVQLSIAAVLRCHSLAEMSQLIAMSRSQAVTTDDEEFEEGTL